MAVQAAVRVAARTKTGRNFLFGVLLSVLVFVTLPFVLVGAIITSAFAMDDGEQPRDPNPGVGVIIEGDWAKPLTHYVITTEWMGYPGHTGMDLAVGPGTPIYAATDGVVISAGWAGQFSYGNMVKIQHAGTLSTLYGHMLHPTHLKVGDKVKVGDVIGLVGSTGNSTGPHLHLETRFDNIPTNPRPVFARQGITL